MTFQQQRMNKPDSDFTLLEYDMVWKRIPISLQYKCKRGDSDDCWQDNFPEMEKKVLTSYYIFEFNSEQIW